VWNDRRLVRRAARGDSDAFATIFRRYEQDLYRYCVAILGNPQDAQDALQNTMVKALRSLPGERREIELKPWLYRVAHNESIELRRRGRPSEPPAEDLGAATASLEDTAAIRGRLRDLLADIAELPERHRGALVMRELGGLDFDEIGAALDTSPGAARQVLYEARRGLQQMSDGREMRCDAVTALLSDGDGRVARRRDVRAHLRDCPGCRHFAEGIRTRSETLAGIAPLPAIAAAAIAKGALAGGGGAATGAGGSGGAGAAGGAAGLAGGAAKVASTGAILKSTVAVVAVVGASAVAVDHARLFHGGGSSDDGTNPSAAVVGTDSEVPTGDSPSWRRASPGNVSRYFKPTGVEEVGSKRPKAADTAAARGRPGDEEPGSTPTATAVEKPDATAPGTSPAGKPADRDPSARHPEHPVHPDHPGHLENRAHPSHPVHPTHPSPPSHAANPTHPSRSEAEPEPESGTKPEGAPAKVAAAPEAAADPEPADETAASGAAAPEPPEAAAHSSPPAEPPGQAKK